jgi:hypothetical protein
MPRPQLFAIVLIDVATSRVWVSPPMRNATKKWVEKHARAFVARAEAERLQVSVVNYLLCRGRWARITHIRAHDSLWHSEAQAIVYGAMATCNRSRLNSPSRAAVT